MIITDVASFVTRVWKVFFMIYKAVIINTLDLIGNEKLAKEDVRFRTIPS